MSLVALGLNLMLAILLMCALVIGVRLERRLRSVREGQLEFAKAVTELDAAAVKARDGLADLRAATDEATDLLGGRIVRAREAADRLERLLNRAESPASAAREIAPVAASTQGIGPEGGLSALLQRLKQAEVMPASQATARVAAAASPMDRPLRLRPAPDEDLFEDLGGRS